MGEEGEKWPLDKRKAGVRVEYANIILVQSLTSTNVGVFLTHTENGKRRRSNALSQKRALLVSRNGLAKGL